MVGRMTRDGTRRVNADLAVGTDVLPPCGRHRRYFCFSEYKIDFQFLDEDLHLLLISVLFIFAVVQRVHSCLICFFKVARANRANVVGSTSSRQVEGLIVLSCKRNS